ncbi:hypothetical protein GGE09_003101 [Roseobacter sp. N2S]|nr:hypothetical protein [Roseobacter sp. N2S]
MVQNGPDFATKSPELVKNGNTVFVGVALYQKGQQLKLTMKNIDNLIRISKSIEVVAVGLGYWAAKGSAATTGRVILKTAPLSVPA